MAMLFPRCLRVSVSALLSVGLVATVAAGEHRQEVADDWAFQHRLAVERDKTGKLVLRRERQQPAPLIDEHAGTLPSDRDPTDQVARRVDALLKHLATAYPAEADWVGYRTRLDPLLAAAKSGKPDLTGEDPERQKTYTALCALRREIALANPLLDFDEIVYSKESNIGSVLQRATTGQYNGLGRAEPGGSLYLIKGWKSVHPQVIDLCQDAKVENGPYKGQSLAGGMFHAPSLTFDGKTILFSWAKLHYQEWPTTPEEAAREDPRKKDADPLRIFRIGVDGTSLRQITVDAGPWNDTEPCELPDGRICFMSTRREVYDRCIAYRPAFTLCSMKPDGSDIIELSFHETHEWLPSVAHDGMILYTRWDYVDRSVHSAHGIWRCFPDGRDPRAPNGNYMWANIFRPDTPYAQYNPPHSRSKRQPCAVSHCKAIPGSRKVMAIGSWHHAVEIGPLLALDLERPDDYAGGQVFSFSPGRWGGDRGGEFSAPTPLSDGFAVANCLDRIYLVDRFGNRELIRRSPDAGRRNRLKVYHEALYGHSGWAKKAAEAKQAGRPVPPKPTFETIAADPQRSAFRAGYWRPTFPLPVKARPRPPAIPPQTFQSQDRRGGPGHRPATITV